MTEPTTEAGRRLERWMAANLSATDYAEGFTIVRAIEAEARADDKTTWSEAYHKGYETARASLDVDVLARAILRIPITDIDWWASQLVKGEDDDASTFADAIAGEYRAILDGEPKP